MVFSDLYSTDLSTELGSADTIRFTTVGLKARRLRALVVKSCEGCGKDFACGGAGNPARHTRFCSRRCRWSKRTEDGLLICAQCKTAKLDEAFRVSKATVDGRHSWCIECFERYRRNRDAMRRRQVLEHYSGGTPLCACCGEAQYEFLTIDHVNNDGNIHRRDETATRGTGIVGWLIRNSYPDGFQVLCYNCNCSKAHNGGVCPHWKAK